VLVAPLVLAVPDRPVRLVSGSFDSAGLAIATLKAFQFSRRTAFPNQKNTMYRQDHFPLDWPAVDEGWRLHRHLQSY
jgi:hypothetical protein